MLLVLTCALLLSNLASGAIILFGGSAHGETKRLTTIGRLALGFILFSAVGGILSAYTSDAQSTKQAEKSDAQLKALAEKAEHAETLLIAAEKKSEQGEKLLEAAQREVRTLRFELSQRDERDQNNQLMKEVAAIKQRADDIRQRETTARRAIETFALESLPLLKKEYTTDTGILSAIRQMDVEPLRQFTDDLTISEGVRNVCLYLVRNGQFFNQGMVNRRAALASLTNLMNLEMTHQYTKRAEVFIEELTQMTRSTPVMNK